MAEQKKIENVIVIGGGPAGYTAALYTARGNLEPLVFEGFQWGGQLQNTTDVENYPGYPEGIMGPEMMNQFRAQAERFGTRFVTDDVDRVELGDGDVHKVFLGDEEHRAKTVILAMGAEPRRLGIPGEIELGGRGVSTCGVCDGAFFKDQKVVVIGGGDSAMEDAIFISKFASDLTVGQPARRVPRLEDHARAAPRAAEHRVQDAVRRRRSSSPARTASSTTCDCATSRPERPRTSRPTAPSSRSATSPNRRSSRAGRDRRGGYIVTQAARPDQPGRRLRVGDVVDHTYRQAVTAAGSGCMGALDAEWYLRDTPPSPEAHWMPGGEPTEIAPAPGS
jgi:thioredoxin reductase (NADPH)